MHCEHCNFVNAEKNLYCKRCGAPLPVLVPYHPSIEDYISPPQMPLQAQPFHFIFHPRPKTNFLKVIRTVFYFAIALPIVLFGLLSALSTHGSDSSTVCLALLASMAVLCASMIMFYRARSREQRLNWSGFILWIMGITTSAFLAFCIEIAAIPDSINKPMGVGLTCSLIMFYGLALECIALW